MEEWEREGGGEREMQRERKLSKERRKKTTNFIL